MLNMFEYADFFDIDIMNYEWNYTVLYFIIIIINQSLYFILLKEILVYYHIIIKFDNYYI